MDLSLKPIDPLNDIIAAETIKQYGIPKCAPNEENDDVVGDLMDIYDSGYVVTTDDVCELLEYYLENPCKQIADPEDEEPRSEVVNRIRNYVAAIKQYGIHKPVLRTDYTNSFQKENNIADKLTQNNVTSNLSAYDVCNKLSNMYGWKLTGQVDKIKEPPVFANKIFNVKEEKNMYEEPAANREYVKNAEAKLTKLALEQGYFTQKDVNDVLGIKKPTSNNQKIVADKISEIPDSVKQSIRNSIMNAYSAVYTADKMPKQLVPYRMWVKEDYTTVEWDDGTKTTAHCEKPENATEYGGFCACLAKKLFGSTSNALKAMDKAIETAEWPAKKKQIERDKLKKLKQERHEHIIQAQKAEHEALVQREIERIKAHAEAERRLNDGNVD